MGSKDQKEERRRKAAEKEKESGESLPEKTFSRSGYTFYFSFAPQSFSLVSRTLGGPIQRRICASFVVAAFRCLYPWGDLSHFTPLSNPRGRHDAGAGE